MISVFLYIIHIIDLWHRLRLDCIILFTAGGSNKCKIWSTGFTHSYNNASTQLQIAVVDSGMEHRSTGSLQSLYLHILSAYRIILRLPKSGIIKRHITYNSKLSGTLA